jgi:fucose permease
MLGFGIVLTTLGAVLPSIIDRFGIDKAQAGALFLVLTLGILAGALVVGPMIDRYGYKGILLFGIALILVGLEGIAFAPSLWLLRVSVALIGFGGGFINSGTNALVADISAEARGANLNLLGVFFGVGAVGVPFILAVLTGKFSQQTLIAGVGAMAAIPLVAIVLTRFPAPKQAQGFPIAAAGALLKEPLLLLMGLMLFLQSGLEITMGGWTSTFVNEELAVPPARALVILSLYWLGMMLARIALGTFLRDVPHVRALYISIAIALVGALSLVVTRSTSVATAGVFLVGLGFAATFPTVLGFIGDRYSDLSGTAFSVALSMALIGGMLLPYLAGVLGGKFGMRGSFVIVPTALVLLVLLLTMLSPRLRRAQ